MRLMSVLVVCLFASLTFFWIWINYPIVRNFTLDNLHKKNLKTLEIRYSADNIMKLHRRALLKDSEHNFLEPTLFFHPYLLMEVKYTKSQSKTGEGVILWSKVDGEMVINTNLWEKTHGFTDCIRAGADKDDFKIINVLSSNNGSMDRESLSKYLNVEDEILDNWIDNCKRKNLIVQNGNHFRLHFQNPKFRIIPETKINQWLVTKEHKKALRIPQKYRTAQIENVAKAAFGNDFAIRKTVEIFLPVHGIKVQNPDGSQMITYWNALNGKKLSKSYYIE